MRVPVALLTGGLLLSLLLGAVRSADAKAPETLAFDLFREGAHIGTHRIAFREEGDSLQVTIDIEIAVKVLFVTAYRYSHRNEETWRDGRLVAISTRTDDDGKKLQVDARPGDGGLLVRASAGDGPAPADIMPTSYWNPATLTASRLLNTQDGRIMQVRLVEVGRERIFAGGETIPATHYRMEGDLRLELWYDLDGRLARIRFQAESDGSVIDYARRRHPDEPIAKLPEGRNAGN